MRITILSVFVSLLTYLDENPVIRRAVSQGLVELEVVDIRQFAGGSFRHIDDSPYGGGRGMIIRYDCLQKALGSVRKNNTYSVLLSPKGHVFDQSKAISFSKMDHLVLVCGHYEGTDSRFDESVDELVSMGDYVLTGGELGALGICDAVIRMLDGTFKEGVIDNESHFDGLLEEPQYTHPKVYESKEVPSVLLSGDDRKIRDFRRLGAISETKKHRPDMALSYMRRVCLDTDGKARQLLSKKGLVLEDGKPVFHDSDGIGKRPALTEISFHDALEKSGLDIEKLSLVFKAAASSKCSSVLSFGSSIYLLYHTLECTGVYGICNADENMGIALSHAATLSPFVYVGQNLFT